MDGGKGRYEFRNGGKNIRWKSGPFEKFYGTHTHYYAGPLINIFGKTDGAVPPRLRAQDGRRGAACAFLSAAYFTHGNVNSAKKRDRSGLRPLLEQRAKRGLHGFPWFVSLIHEKGRSISIPPQQR